MSSNLPPAFTHPYAKGHAQPLAAAARQLWSQLLAVPIKMHQLTRLSTPVADMSSPWSVMQAVDDLPLKGRFYWQDRQHQFEIMGFGMADDRRHSHQHVLAEQWTQMQAITRGTKALYIGGLSFNGRNGEGAWQGFDALRFALPIVEWRRSAKQIELTVQLYAASPEQWHQQFNSAREVLHRLCNTTLTELKPLPAVKEHHHLTGKKQWQQQVQQSLLNIQNHQLDKVVLARATAFVFNQPASLASFADQWQQRTPGTFGFAVNFGTASFIGFSPERLLRQNGTEIATEALAGTQPRGANGLDDLEYEQVLRHDPKLIHEHKLVADFITDQLAPFSKHLLSDAQVSILKLANVQHRQARYRAQLTSPEQVPSLLQALFPTPAVCGLPRQAAFTCIDQTEPTPRGWYAGSVGVIGDKTAEFSVAIRSGLLQSQRFINYAGAGIVQGSKATDEWDELNDKVNIVERLLN